MKFSRKTDYGIILIQSLRHTFFEKEYVPLSEISDRQKLPLPFLEKLAEVLRKKGYFESKRGPEGGYRLVKDPRKITLQELIDVFEEPEMMRCMKSSHPEQYCPFVELCPSRGKWIEIEKRVKNIFKEVTLDAM